MRLKIRSDGFTLLEILMVVTLVAIVMAVAASQFVNFTSDAKTNVTKDRLNSLKLAIDGDPRLAAAGKYSSQGFANDCLGPPMILTDLITQPTSPPWPAGATCVGAGGLYNPFTKLGWNGPYVSTTDPNWNMDGWGTAIQYNGAPTRTLVSCGPDMVCGDGDDITVSF